MHTVVRFAACAALGLCASLALAKGDLSASEPQFSFDDSVPGDPLPNGGPIVHVYSENGDRYDFVGHLNEPVIFSATFSGSCGRVYKANSAQFRIGETTEGFSVPGDRGAWFSRTGVVHLPKDQLDGFDAVQACNAKLKSLSADTHKSKEALIREGFGIRYRDQLRGRGSLFCSGSNNTQGANVDLDVWVYCRPREVEAPTRAAKVKVKTAELVPLISNLQFHVDKERYVGKCPTGIVFGGSITASRAGRVRYRTVGNDGSKSPEFTLEFGGAGTKAISDWGETFSRPDPGQSLSAGGATTEGPDYAGWRRLEIVEPAGFAPSTPAEYAITCQEQPVQLQAVPAKPTRQPARVKDN